jgi:hypothetical protein
MTSSITDKPIDGATDSATALANLISRAAAQGIKPFTSLKDFAGDPEVTGDFDVELFLRQVREDRDWTPSQTIE